MKREIKIGFFLAGTLAILAVFIFIVGDFAVLFQKPGYPLFISFETVAGLDKGAAVRMSGVKIGYVKDISLAQGRAMVLVNISPKVKVNKGSRGTLASLGLLGERYVEILPGESPESCSAGETLTGIPAAGFDQIGSLFLSIGEEIKKLSGALGDLMSEESRTNFKGVLDNLSGFSSELKEVLGSNKEGLHRAIQESSRAVQNFDRRTEVLSRELDETLKAVRGMADDNRVVIKENMEKIKSLLEEIEKSVQLLNGSLEKINKSEGTLGKIVNEPELYEEAEEALASFDRAVRPLAALKSGWSVQTDYYGESALLKPSLSFNVRFDPKKFVLAQAVHNPWEDRFVYSFQGGMRSGNIVPRAGVIESEFGAGLDYLAFRDRLVLSLDSFDWNRDPRPVFRLTTRLYAHRSFFFVLGLDDLAWSAKREFYFGLGFGVR